MTENQGQLMSPLAGKTVLIGGAAGAIGRETVALMVARGARVVAVDSSSIAIAALTNEASESALTAITADVADEPSVAAFVASASAITGRLDGLVNLAGIEGDQVEIPDYSLQRFEQVMRVNVNSVFLAMKYALPVMARQGGGSIVNVSSSAGLRGSRAMSAYVASKHAVVGLTRTAAVEWADRGVRVNSVNPGAVEGPMMNRIANSKSPQDPDALRREVTKRIPAGRFAQPAEIAALIAFLISDDAAFINGAVHLIDGGGQA